MPLARPVKRLRAAMRVGALLAVAIAVPALSAASALGGFGEALEHLPADVRALLQTRAAQWAQWTPAQQAAFTQRLAAWDALPPAQRGELRERYAAWRALPVEEQAQVQAAMQRFAALPAEQQQALRAQFAMLDRSERRGWLLGPVLGANYMALQPLLAQVPEAERPPMLQALRTMTPAQRASLAVLVQRTPPQDRAALRRELLATAALNRDEWLRQRLAR